MVGILVSQGLLKINDPVIVRILSINSLVTPAERKQCSKLRVNPAPGVRAHFGGRVHRY